MRHGHFFDFQNTIFDLKGFEFSASLINVSSPEYVNLTVPNILTAIN